MDLSAPESAVSTALDIKVLVTLAGTTRPLTGRQIARVCGRSKTGVAVVLQRLVEQGTLDVLEAGSSLLYTLNREHLVAPAVIQLAGIRQELLRRLADEVSTWEPPALSVALFGSVARGDGDSESDIDLLIIRPGDVDEENETWRAQLDAFAEHVLRWTGNHSQFAELSQSDIRRLVRDEAPILDDLRRDAVDLAGVPVWELLRSAD
jgi:predicted nucleotidyltransferase